MLHSVPFAKLKLETSKLYISDNFILSTTKLYDDNANKH